MKLRSVCKRNLRRLFGHGASDLLHPMTDVHDGRLPGSVQITPAVACGNPTAFRTHRYRILFSQIAGEKRRRFRLRTHTEIVTDGLKMAFSLPGAPTQCSFDL